MSASTATTTGSNTPANKVNASATLSEDESFHKRAAEAEAKHVANVATQNRKLEMVEKKLNEKLSSNGKALVLKDKPTRPTHRPTRKNRKPLSPPSNKEHDTRTAAVDIKATIKEKRQLAILLTSRPSLNYDRIIEQHVVNGVVERITQPDNSQHTSVVNKTLPTYSYVDIVEQRVVNNVSERIPGSADTPQAAASNIDTDSDSAAESDNDTEEHVPKLVQEASTAHQSTDSLLERSSSVKAASATASSHVYDDVSMIDVDNEALLLSFANEAALAAAPVELPVTAFKDQKPNKAKEKDAKASDLLKEVAMVDLEVPQKQLKLDTARTATGNADPTTLADDGYVTALLKMPNGPGVTRKSRNFHEKQVAMHITPFALPVTAPKQDKTLKANQKVVKVGGKKIVSCERKKAHDLHNHLVQMHVPSYKLPFSAHGQKKTKRTKSVDTPVAKFIHGPVAVDASADDTELIVGDYASNVANLEAENSMHDKGTLIGSVSQINPFPINKAKDNLQQIDVRVTDTIEKQVIPDDTTPVTPPTSDLDFSSSGSDYPKSTKTSRRSSLVPAVDSIRRKAEKARTAFLGKTSLEMFVNILDFERCDGTTTKDDVCKAFASLAGCPIASLESVKIQRKIKLGGTSLYGFLHQLDFDDNEITLIGKVMNTFEEAAKNELVSSKLDLALWLAESSRDDGSHQGLHSLHASKLSAFRQIIA
ncbi:hypothetical protein AA0113_g4347 [Alternaria arborescens]|uniref:Uncharacterized protein n=1 Tax=Alternaria arborescens TaxID=156630 RepID=A0A4Q4SFB1_9PLEO|nr:hypothetical protein AA0111_g1500 [Alternaria arborescens]RYO39570.1 hypothetical protein AA0111_g1500 [Alternaria arborescens]RYO69190.1 hypothetical protein AA0113_g4347 [Alternaria arborescens]